MKKYYLLKYSFQSSLGGYDEDLGIVDISYDREDFIERILDALEDKDITHINDYEVDEFEFDENESMWRIDYEPSGMCMRDSVTYKIVESED